MAIDDDTLDDRAARYGRVVAPIEDRLRRALVARYGVDVGCDAAADSLAWAWEHLDRVESAANPAGYLFRVGQSSAKRMRRWHRRPISFPAESPPDGAGTRPSDELGGDIFDALRSLPDIAPPSY